MNTLRVIFSIATVVFLGYSVSDQYLIDLLSDNAKDMSLFGAGPHFVVSAEHSGVAGLRQISYLLKRFPDHRSAMTVIDVIREVEVRKGSVSAANQTALEARSATCAASPLGNKTAYFLSDFMPPGTWNNSVTARLEAKSGPAPEMTVGLGFSNDEIPFQDSTAPHDLAVGLICFDYVYFSLSALGRVHEFLNLLGPHFFWQLVNDDVIRFVHLRDEPAVIIMEDSVIGDVGLVSISQTNSGMPESPATFIRRQIYALPGKEAVADKLISDLERRVISFGEAVKIEMASLVRAALMMPGVARLLGIGEAILPTQVPRWLTFPYLRMAHLVHTGAVCDYLGLQAAKIPFGGKALTSAAFGVQPATETADQYASYIVSGRFDTNLGAALVSEPALLVNILQFRNTADGEALRREVRDQLVADESREFSASINAGLARIIPINTLRRAHDKLSTLLTENITISPVPAVWTSALQSDDATRFWRTKSRARLIELAKQRKVKGDDSCLCGSGDKLRLCCLPPLRD